MYDYDKNFFIYAYLSLLRGMSNDENELDVLREKLDSFEYLVGYSAFGYSLREIMDTFMWKYGLNTDYLK